MWVKFAGRLRCCSMGWSRHIPFWTAAGCIPNDQSALVDNTAIDKDRVQAMCSSRLSQPFAEYRYHKLSTHQPRAQLDTCARVRGS